MSAFEEKKQLKERGYTVKQALSDAKDSKEVIAVYIDKEGEVHVSFSTEEGNVPQMLGLLEMAKMMILENSQ